MWDLALAAGVSFLITLILHAGLARKVYTLRLDVAMLQEQLLRERNQRASMARSRDKADAQTLLELQQGQPAPTKVLNPLAKFGIAK